MRLATGLQSRNTLHREWILMRRSALPLLSLLGLQIVACATHLAHGAEMAAGDLAPRGAPDGNLTAADILVLQRIVLGDLAPTSLERLIADVAPRDNPDGELNAGDLVVLMRAAMGEITLSPIRDDTPPLAANLDLISATIGTSGTINVTGAAGSVEAGAAVTFMNFTTGSRTTISATETGAFEATLGATPDQVFGITVSDGFGNASPRVSMSQQNPLSIQIVTPADSALIADDSVNITGTFTGPPDTAITINGKVACIQGTSFVVPQLPLRTGANTLQANATTHDELITTRTHQINSSGPSPLTARMTPPCGPAPHTARVYLDNRSAELVSVDIDFDGDGILEISNGDPKAPLSFTFPNPGRFDTTIWANDINGTTYYRELPVIATDISVMDDLLRNTYSEMLERLRAGALEGGLNMIATPARQHYKSVFDALAPDLGAIVDQLGTLDKGTIGTEYAEYLLIRTRGPGGDAFLIYFIRGEDGVWRLSEM